MHFKKNPNIGKYLEFYCPNQPPPLQKTLTQTEWTCVPTHARTARQGEKWREGESCPANWLWHLQLWHKHIPVVIPNGQVQRWQTHSSTGMLSGNPPGLFLCLHMFWRPTVPGGAGLGNKITSICFRCGLNHAHIVFPPNECLKPVFLLDWDCFLWKFVGSAEWQINV